MSFQTLDTKLMAILTALTGAGQPLNFVYQGNRTDIEGYPSALLIKSDSASDYETTRDNRRTYVYYVYILQEVESTGITEADQILAEVADQVMDAIDNDYTLGGTAIMVRAVPSIWGNMQIGTGQAQFARLTVEVDILYELT
jgi:hypothetical protein